MQRESSNPPSICMLLCHVHEIMYVNTYVARHYVMYVMLQLYSPGRGKRVSQLGLGKLPCAKYTVQGKTL